MRTPQCRIAAMIAIARGVDVGSIVRQPRPSDNLDIEFVRVAALAAADVHEVVAFGPALFFHVMAAGAVERRLEVEVVEVAKVHEIAKQVIRLSS